MSDDDETLAMNAILDDLEGLTPVEIAKHVHFWMEATRRWQEWADKLVSPPPPPLTLSYGDDGNRERLERELLGYRQCFVCRQCRAKTPDTHKMDCSRR